MNEFRFAHLSDPHLPPLPRPRQRELVGKRALGYLNWVRNRRRHQRRDILDSLIADVLQQKPDHIVITGDIVNLSLRSEFAAARQWLEGVGSPEYVSIVPGNHDAYVHSTAHCFVETLGAYAGNDDQSTAFPFLRRRGPLALIGVSTAVPTAPLMATGWLGPAQRHALDQMLKDIAHDDLFRVLLIHHPLQSASRPKRLVDSVAVLTLLAQHQIDLALHGHDHIHSTMWFDGPTRRFPAIGVPSASAAAHGHVPAAAYNIFTVSRAGNAWSCTQAVRGRSPDGTMGELQRVKLI